MPAAHSYLSGMTLWLKLIPAIGALALVTALLILSAHSELYA